MSHIRNVNTNQLNGIPEEYNKQTANSENYLIQQGALNKLRLRPRILNEHCESSREIQSVVTSTNIVGQIFKNSQDNINGIHIAGESAAGSVFEDFESYIDSAALQAAWVPSGSLNLLETVIVQEGNNSMKLPLDNLGDEWTITIASTDFENYTGHIHVYQDKEYNKAKIRFFVGDGANTASVPCLAINKNTWYTIDINMTSLTEDGVGTTDLTAITKVGFRVEDKEAGKFAYIDHMISIPPPGEINIKLWHFGSTLPTIANKIDDATQYTKLGDLGITGIQVSEVNVNLLGGFRIYPVKNFVAGVALEMDDNELLIKDDYYAITINYVDTNFNVYGPNSIEAARYEPAGYYENGFAFTAPDESTSITKIGQYIDIMFAIFSTADVYLINMRHSMNDTPKSKSNLNVYLEDNNMKRTATIIASTNGYGKQTLKIDNLIDKPMFLKKGGKLEEEYTSDPEETVTEMEIGMRYMYIEPVVNG